jgi:hypothetical protein
MMSRMMVFAVAASLALGGCASILRQELQTRLGPCRGEMKRMETQFGRPEEVESEEDDIDGARVYTVDWIYPERDDLVVRFEWEEGEDYCQVSRTARRY